MAEGKQPKRRPRMADLSEEERERQRERSRRWRQKNRKQVSAYNRRYREEHRDEIADYKRRYKDEHAEEIAEYKKAYRERNLEHELTRNREYMRAQAEKARRQEARRVAKAAYARQRYHADIEASRARKRELEARQREADPEGFRQAHARHNKAWRERNREEINARTRERNRLDPAPKAKLARRYYENHGDEIRARRRERYQQNKERENARAKLWRQREKRRRDLGLPSKRLHRLPLEERRRNVEAADAFFARPVTPALRAKVEEDLRTPLDMVHAFQRELARIRAEQYALRNPEVKPEVVDRRTAEEKRMDEIARHINDRLRQNPRRPDPAAYQPPTPTPAPQKGLGR